MTMKAMGLDEIVSLDEIEEPLTLVDMPRLEHGDGEIRIGVSACGVCHAELDEIEGRTVPTVLPVVLGHEVVGRVAASGAEAAKFKEGDRDGGRTSPPRRRRSDPP